MAKQTSKKTSWWKILISIIAVVCVVFLAFGLTDGFTKNPFKKPPVTPGPPAIEKPAQNGFISKTYGTFLFDSIIMPDSEDATKIVFPDKTNVAGKEKLLLANIQNERIKNDFKDKTIRFAFILENEVNIELLKEYYPTATIYENISEHADGSIAISTPRLENVTIITFEKDIVTYKDFDNTPLEYKQFRVCAYCEEENTFSKRYFAYALGLEQKEKYVQAIVSDKNNVLDDFVHAEIFGLEIDYGE